MNSQYDVGCCGFHVQRQPRWNWGVTIGLAIGFCTGYLLDKYIEFGPEVWEAVRDLL